MDNDDGVTIYDDLKLFNEMVRIYAEGTPEERLRNAEAIAQEMFDLMASHKLSLGDQLLAVAVMSGSMASGFREKQPEILREIAGECRDDIQQRKTASGLHGRSRQHRRFDV